MKFKVRQRFFWKKSKGEGDEKLKATRVWSANAAAVLCSRSSANRAWSPQSKADWSSATSMGCLAADLSFRRSCKADDVTWWKRRVLHAMREAFVPR